MHLPQFVRDHPYLVGIGGGGVLLLLFLWLFRGGSASANGSGSDWLSAYYNAESAATQSGNALQQANLGAQVSSNQITAQAATDQAAIAAQVSLGQILGQIQTTQIGADRDVNLAAIAAGRDVSLAQVQGGVDLGMTQARELTAQTALTAAAAQNINFAQQAVQLQAVSVPYGQGATGLAPAAIAANYGGGFDVNQIVSGIRQQEGQRLSVTRVLPGNG